MNNYVVVILGLHIATAAPPLTLKIDCGSHHSERPASFIKSRSPNIFSKPHIDSLCSIIHNALPKSVEDGQFVLIREADQARSSNNQIQTSVLPPKGFIPKLGPKFRIPKVKVPKFKVPRLKPAGHHPAPRVGAANFPYLLNTKERDEESSAERMEKFKKGVQKMLHVVKVLGQIDQYVSERTRAVVDILSRTFSE